MGLFDKIFNLNNSSVEHSIENRAEQSNEPIVVIKEIDEILSILGQLGLLDQETIENNLKDDKNFESSILKRIMIKTDEENISHLLKYFKDIKLGYGSVKLNQIKDRMNDLVSEKINEGKNKAEVIEELISLARIEVENYERVLKSFNETIGKLEENSSNESELIVMMDYWVNYFKEQELGYPINLQNKVDTMVRELAQLPYGGYGSEEIKRFIEAANKMIEEAKNNKEESNHTVNRITTSLFTPKKNRYMSDVETLKRKLQMISESPYLSDIEKNNNKQQTIREFNQMNGHILGIQESIEQMRTNLTLLECGGFGPLIIDKFITKALEISRLGKESGKSDESIINEIQIEYNKLLNEYQIRLNRLKEKIQITQEKEISQEEKDRIRLELLEDFRDEMGHPIDYKEKIERMISSLKALPNGGYGELVLEEFRKKAYKEIESQSTLAEKNQAYSNVRKEYYRLMDEYNEKEKNYESRKNEIEKSRNVEPEDKKGILEELERTFMLENGHVIDYKSIIANYASELSSLGKVGYGEKAVKAFIDESNKIVESEISAEDKYKKIRQKYLDLKDRYLVNQNTFNEWKFLQLKSKSGKEKEELAEDLDKKIAYMLSLSPNELAEFYIEDDKKKSSDRINHNYKIAYKFLAKQEARKNNDESLYARRMEELESGHPAYSDDEIKDATTRIERIELTSDDIKDEDRLISVVEYIDSTLLRQMLYVEAATSKKRYSK